ncbi:MAG: hypothetical protein R2795_12005 [Saprospiraceae bacterium]
MHSRCRPTPPTDIKKGVVSPVQALQISNPDAHTLHRLNLLYAKDYELWSDVELLWKARHAWGA